MIAIIKQSEAYENPFTSLQLRHYYGDITLINRLVILNRNSSPCLPLFYPPQNKHP